MVRSAPGRGDADGEESDPVKLTYPGHAEDLRRRAEERLDALVADNPGWAASEESYRAWLAENRPEEVKDGPESDPTNP